MVNTPFIFLKDPNIYNLKDFYDWFPNGKIFFLIRDGRDLVESSLKATLLVRKSQSKRKKIKSFLKYWSGKALIDYSKAYTRHYSELHSTISFFETNQLPYLLLKYEELFLDPINQLDRLFKYLEIELPDEVLKKMCHTEIVGSSFFRELSDRQNWTPQKSDASFKPIGRWQSWPLIKKLVFKRYAGEALVKAGYEKDLKW